MTIYEALKRDHDHFRNVFERVKETTERAEKTREEVLEDLERTLLTHAKAEEKMLYTRLEQDKETFPVSLEAIEEHRVAERLMKELRGVDTSDPHWTAKMEVLREAIEHHLDEEEGEMFKKAKKVLSEEEAEQIGEAFLEEKKRLQEQL